MTKKKRSLRNEKLTVNRAPEMVKRNFWAVKTVTPVLLILTTR